MKALCILFLAFIYSSPAFTQNIEGEWVGHFKSSQDGSQTTYSIIFSYEDGKLIAYTRTDFRLGNNIYYSICKAKVKTDSAKQMITVTEDESVNRNTPIEINDCFQKHILRVSEKNNNEFLTGTWVTASNNINCGNGTTRLQRKKKPTASQS